MEDRVNYIQLCMVHRIVKNEIPKYLCNYFSRILNTHSYSTTRVGYVCSSSSSIATTTQGEVQLIWCCSDLEVAWERALFYIQLQFYGMGYLLV